MRETYETEKNMYIIMEQVTGGELFDHIKTYELEEREVGLCMFELIKAIHSLIKSYCHLLPSKMKVLFIYFKFLYNFYLHFLFVNLLIFMIDS